MLTNLIPTINSITMLFSEFFRKRRAIIAFMHDNSFSLSLPKIHIHKQERNLFIILFLIALTYSATTTSYNSSIIAHYHAVFLPRSPFHLRFRFDASVLLNAVESQKFYSCLAFCLDSPTYRDWYFHQMS